MKTAALDLLGWVTILTLTYYKVPGYFLQKLQYTQCHPLQFFYICTHLFSDTLEVISSNLPTKSSSCQFLGRQVGNSHSQWLRNDVPR